MLSPLKIQIPSHLFKNIEVTRSLPPGFKYKISFAKCTYYKGDIGEFVIQSFSGADYWMDFWSLESKTQGSLDIIVNEPSICVALFLKGNFGGHLLGHGAVNAPANTYCIFYLPVGTHKVSLQIENYTLLSIILPPNYLNGMAAEHTPIREIVSRFTKGSEITTLLANFPIPQSVWRILKKMESINKKESALDLALRKYILEILEAYNEQFKLSVPAFNMNLSSPEKSLAVRDYILANLGSATLGGLNELSYLFHLSPKTLTKQFKLFTGKTIPQFINDERMGWAKRLLKDKKLHVFEVAQLVGFSDTANFIRKYKKKFGMSPGDEHGKKKN